MLDLFRLIETFNRGGALAEHLRLAPGQLAAVVAEVVTREILAQPASAARLMSTLTPGPVTADDVGDVLDVFLADLLP